MIAIALRFLAANWIRAALIGGAVTLALAGAAYVRHIMAENTRLTGQLSRTVDIANENAETIIKLQADAQRRILALAAERRALELRIARLTPIRTEIANAPVSEDGPVAPVLRRALDGLWGDETGDQGRDRAPDGAGKPAGMP